ncbi:MAG: LytTR family DNA-binding domain-containing protein [Prevotellaceae bacterium]|jgi:DNA-binding LytR/AlgR family response regulator|nr:LytTR family DNA-binding domain-containing protein [Prevotellaceae bacterium]
MRCIIVDDEPLARKGIELLINKTEGLEMLGEFCDASSAAAFLDDNNVDLIFLDIQMPGANGIEFAKTIGSKTLVVFTTAYAEYALDSYEVDAIDYLVKPVKLARFQKAVSKARSYFEMLARDRHNRIETVENDYIFIKSDRKFIKVHFNDLLFIEGLRDYVVIHTAERKVITLITLKNIQSRLPENIFVRVSKSYIVNIKHVSSLDNNDVIIGKHEIPIGGTYRNELFERFIEKKIVQG